MAALPEDIFFASISELGAKLRAGEVSPVELTRAFCERFERLGPRYNAVAQSLREQAIRKAREFEGDFKHDRARGPLHAIPFGVKDLLAVKGHPTTWGAKPYANQVLDYDATVIEHLNRAGAVLLGKASMIELAGGMNYRFASASLQGAAKNPWDTSCWTCGSSSGSMGMRP